MGDVISQPGFIGLVYFVAAAIATIVVDTARRYVKRRMDIWEAEHPVPDGPPKKEEDDDQASGPMG